MKTTHLHSFSACNDSPWIISRNFTSEVIRCKYKLLKPLFHWPYCKETYFPLPLPPSCLFEEIVAKRDFLHDQLQGHVMKTTFPKALPSTISGIFPFQPKLSRSPAYSWYSCNRLPRIRLRREHRAQSQGGDREVLPVTWGGWACGIKGHSSPDTVTSVPVYTLGPTVRPGDGEGDVDTPFVLISFLFLKLSLHQGTLQSLFGKIWLSLNARGISAESSSYGLKMMTQWNSDRVKRQQNQTPSGARSFVSYLILAK